MSPLARVGLFAVTFSLLASSALAAPPTLPQKLTELKQFVGSGANGAKWHAFLRTSDLEAQLKAEKPDRAVLESILTRYSGSENGLGLPKFAAVKTELKAWLNSLPVASLSELAEQARADKDKFVATTAAQQQAALAALVAAEGKLAKYLHPGSKYGPGWRKYLNLDGLEAQIKPGATPDLDELETIYRQFVSGAVGLELPLYTDVRGALRTYIDRLDGTDSPETKAAYNAHLDALAKALEKAAADPTAPSAPAAEPFAWLLRTGQDPKLSAGVRQHFSKPNLYVEVTRDLMAGRIDREVHDISPVRDNILGTRISGTGNTNGLVKLVLVPSENSAIYDMVFSGTTASRTVGVNGPARISSNGTTSFVTRKRVVLDGTGVKTFAAEAKANTKTRTTGVNTTINIPVVKHFVNQYARQQVAEKKGQGEYIGARHAETRLEKRFDAEVNAKLVEANQKIQNLLNTARRYGQPTDQLRFRTSAEALFVTGFHANALQLAALSDPPAAPAEGDMIFRMHESMVPNVAAALAGQTIHKDRFKRELADLLGETPTEDDEDEPGTMTLALGYPVSFSIRDGLISLTIHGDSFTRGDKVHEGMDISVAYKLEKKGDMVVAVRQPDSLRVRPPGFVQGKDKMSLGQTNFAKILEKTFAKRFKEEIPLEIQPKDSPNKLIAIAATADKGWLSLVWEKQGDAKPEPMVTSKKAPAVSSKPLKSGR